MGLQSRKGHPVYSTQSVPCASSHYLFTSINLDSLPTRCWARGSRHQEQSSPEATTHEALAVCQVSCHLLMCVISSNTHKPTRQELVSLSLFYRWQDSVGEPMQFACVIQQVTRKAEIWIRVCLTSKPTHSAIFPDITGNKSRCYS